MYGSIYGSIYVWVSMGLYGSLWVYGSMGLRLDQTDLSRQPRSGGGRRPASCSVTASGAAPALGRFAVRAAPPNHHGTPSGGATDRETRGPTARAPHTPLNQRQHF